MIAFGEAATIADAFDPESWIHRFEMWGGSVFIWKDTLHISMATVDGAQLRPLLAEVEADPQRRAAIDRIARQRTPGDVLGARCFG